MEENPSNNYLIRTFAGEYGLIIGVMWCIAFACSMYSSDNVLLGHLGNLVALLSLFVEVRQLKLFQMRIMPLGAVKRFSMAMQINFCAVLLTTMGQYIYFRFLDNGHMMNSLTKLFDLPEYQDMLGKIMPGMNAEELLKMFSQISIGDLLMSLITFNLFAALAVSMLTTAFSSVPQVKMADEEENAEKNEEDKNEQESE